MANVYKGILSFPALFTPKIAKGATEPKYGLQLLFPPGDPELTRIWNDYQIALKEAYPSGLPNKADACLMNYREKFQGKEYYDPKLAEWWVFSCSAKVEDKPTVVDMNRQPVLDPGSVCSGMLVHVNAGISGYTKGTGGIGGWLNGVMVTGEMGQLGRLDNKPSVDQMFAGVTGGAPVGAPPAAPGAAPAYTAAPAPTPAYTAAPAPTPGYSAPPAAPAMPSAPVPLAPPAAPVPAAAPAKVMTAKAGGATYESFITNGWTDVMLVEHGYMTIGGITPSFVG